MSTKQTKAPCISIIVPVYQVERYLRECLDSILRQSFRDWELLLIDDGSLDAGGAICDEYAARDERIRVFHQQNAGPSAARNVGISASRGAYLAFLDPDDVFLSADYLQIMLDGIVQHNACQSVCGMIAFQEKDPAPAAKKEFEGVRLLSGKEFLMDSALGEGYSVGSVNAMLFRRSDFKTICFPDLRYAEDNAILHRLLYPSAQIAVCGMQMYGYRHRKGGAVAGGDPLQKYGDAYCAFQDRIAFFNDRREWRLSEAAKRIWRHLAVKLFLQACAQNKEKSIPQNEWLSKEEIALCMAECDRKTARLLQRRIDPAWMLPGTEKLMEREIRLARRLLAFCGSVCGVGKSNTQALPAAYGDSLLSMGKEQRLLALVCAGMQSRQGLSQKLRSRLSAGRDFALRQCLAEDGALRLISQKAQKQGIACIPLAAYVVRSCYPDWRLRDGGDLQLLLEAIPQAVSPAPGLIADLGQRFTGKRGACFHRLGKSLLSEKRELSPEEAWLLLLAGWQADRKAGVLRLNALVDAACYWRAHGEKMQRAGELEKQLSALSLWRFHRFMVSAALHLTDLSKKDVPLSKAEKGLIWDAIK